MLIRVHCDHSRRPEEARYFAEVFESSDDMTPVYTTAYYRTYDEAGSVAEAWVEEEQAFQRNLARARQDWKAVR